jgi:nucleoid-associated protein YgaU
VSSAQPIQLDRPTAESNDSGVDSTVAARTDDDAKPEAQPDQDANTQDTGATVGKALTPTVITAPATQPAATAQPNSDWQGALDHGLPVAVAAPERTMTPTIDPVSSNTARGEISRSPTTPMIDPLPSTQPSRPLMADIPTLEAAPAPVATALPPPAAATQDPTSSFTSSASVASTTPRTHRVESGESPYSISEAVYGSGRYYKRILAANPGIDPRHLKIGQVLIIPDLSTTDRATPSAAANTAVPEVNDTRTSYRVQSGDSLESISMKLYGTPRMQSKLYEMNKTLIGPDENVLKIGWILKLPQAPTAAADQR